MVVAGILIALAAQSWWQGRERAEREEVYLRQLAADLAATERQIAQADSFHRPVDRAGALLLQAYFAPVPPPRDSVLLWLERADEYETVRPVTGTAEALALTGDLGLLRDLELQAAVTSYVDQSRNRVDDYQTFVGMYNPAADRLLRRLSRGEYLSASLPQTAIDSKARADDLYWLPAGARRPTPRIDTDELLREREVHISLSEMNLAKRNLRRLRGEMRDDALALRKQVEAALSR